MAGIYLKNEFDILTPWLNTNMLWERLNVDAFYGDSIRVNFFAEWIVNNVDYIYFFKERIASEQKKPKSEQLHHGLLNFQAILDRLEVLRPGILEADKIWVELQQKPLSSEDHRLKCLALMCKNDTTSVPKELQKLFDFYVSKYGVHKGSIGNHQTAIRNVKKLFKMADKKLI